MIAQIKIAIEHLTACFSAGIFGIKILWRNMSERLLRKFPMSTLAKSGRWEKIVKVRSVAMARGASKARLQIARKEGSA